MIRVAIQSMKQLISILKSSPALRGCVCLTTLHMRHYIYCYPINKTYDDNIEMKTCAPYGLVHVLDKGTEEIYEQV